MESSGNTLRLEDLKRGYPGVSPTRAAQHAEACALRLVSQTHKPGVHLNVLGDHSAQYAILWEFEITEQIMRSYDEIEATDDGAVGLAFLLVLKLTEYTIVERGRIGTGFDYFLGYARPELFERSARLEISGIRSARSDSEIEARVRSKLSQTDRSDNGGLPAYIVVVDFGRPEARLVRK